MNMFAALTFAIALSKATPELDIAYRKVEGTEVKADFYPAKLHRDQGDPFVIVIHGGAWVSGKRQDMAAICEALANANISSATIDYRLAPASKWPAQIDDCQAAVRYFRANAKRYGIDAERMGSLGASAGGHLALLLGFTDTRDIKTLDNPLISSRTQAVVNLFGPVDLSKDFAAGFASYISLQVTGQKYDPESADVKAFSPYNAIDSKSAPVFTIHGDKDALVPPKQAERLDEQLKAKGVFHDLRMIPGMGHEVDLTNKDCVKALEDAVKFLSERLTVSRLSK